MHRLIRLISNRIIRCIQYLRMEMSKRNANIVNTSGDDGFEACPSGKYINFVFITIGGL